MRTTLGVVPIKSPSVSYDAKGNPTAVPSLSEWNGEKVSLNVFLKKKKLVQTFSRGTHSISRERGDERSRPCALRSSSGPREQQLAVPGGPQQLL